jgi:hypothetical protein
MLNNLTGQYKATRPSHWRVGLLLAQKRRAVHTVRRAPFPRVVKTVDQIPRTMPTAPRATASRTRKTPVTATVSAAAIACRAYELFTARGGEHGHDLEDWLRAERELTGQAAPSTRQASRRQRKLD